MPWIVVAAAAWNIIVAAAPKIDSLTGTRGAVADDGVVVGVPTTVLNFDATWKDSATDCWQRSD